MTWFWDHVVLVYFSYQKKIIEDIKTNTKVRWSQTKPCWSMGENDFTDSSTPFFNPLLEQITELCYIQELLGHESGKTTEIYTYASKKDFYKFKNPIDDLNFDDG